MGIRSYTFLPYRKIVKKPKIQEYSDNPKTIGEHLRKKRIESGLLQKYVALLLNVFEDCVTYWENGRSTPQIHHYPRIINFLGYYPFDHDSESYAGKLLQIRHCKGLSIKQCAALLSVSEDAAKRWERGKPIAMLPTKSLFIPFGMNCHFINYNIPLRGVFKCHSSRFVNYGKLMVFYCITFKLLLILDSFLIACL